jgi:hypothetical protein
MHFEDWPIIPLDAEALAQGSAIDHRRKLERQCREVAPEPPQTVELSFSCRNITVSSYLGALKIADAFDQVVSLGTRYDFPLDLFPGHPARRRYCFDDVSQATPEELEAGVKLPAEVDIRELFAFAKSNQSILIHCQAGISRSPAMAVLLARYWNYPMAEVLSGLNIKKVYPNKRLLSLGEAVLGVAPGTLAQPIFERLANSRENPPLPRFEVGKDGTYQITPPPVPE